ncbi:Coenzyme Q-binding protein COQ10A isoform 1 [Schistosoma japonicum]|nr:SJCHGC04817 protein [Schistosoma japonicum]KAH8849341.1 Coenzyme Q-binding protein COQ10 like, mitochondrial [Schistosoma japonicum]KAH8849342.1 Coenzyme Q-binding protein COQ10 like, mitochondrial [Schistosoma japonicum]KAH8849343.1 Coenzyme Q-binding protein COQ10 like, mitochondrial [Schistosoma japonicum]TNN06606.1 Coenzyme Q-binding protein COQ10A isoform 1 [Schistosoma japonicum]
MTSLKLLTTYSRYSYPMLQAVPHVFGRKIYSFGSNHIKKSQSYKERRLLGYSPENMFDIAIDVGRYSEFVPWCNHSTIIKQGENDMLARLGVGFPPLSESYMSRITFQRPKHLKSVAQNVRMFHHLINEWNFQPGLPDNPNTCFVEFSVDFEFRSLLYAKIAGLFFDQVVTVMVNAFMDRARVLHGKPSVESQKPSILIYNK